MEFSDYLSVAMSRRSLRICTPHFPSPSVINFCFLVLLLWGAKDRGNSEESEGKMSKILCTLAFYHDGGTLKPQLVFSTNPVTNLVMKGTDWKSARISNTNANAGARNRFEYSFTGGKSVTRCSLVMNTSAILPPFIWLSKHPCGPPTKTGLRAKPGSKAHEEAKLKAAREKRRLAAREDTKRIESSGRRSSSPRDERKEMLAEHGIYDEEQPKRLENRSHSSSSRRYDRYPEEKEMYQIPDREMRREERQRRLRGVSAASSTVAAAAVASSATSASPPAYTYEDPDPYAGIPDRETRRQQRLKRLRSNSSASESSDSGAGAGDRYRRSSRSGRYEEPPHRHRRHHRRYHGGEYASGNGGVDRFTEEGGDGGDGGDGGGDGGAGGGE